jgi:membrane protein implicated in regulation of membrane protease activity
MPRPSIFDAPIYVGLVVLGIGLVVLARWAANRKGTRWESLVALRIGDVLFTEMLGAFIVGYAIGSLVVPQLDYRPGPGPSGRVMVGPGGFDPFRGSRLPLILGVVLAAIAAIVRIDWTDHLLRGPSRGNALSAYVGWDAKVVGPIRAGEFGEIALPDGSGNVVAVSATADTDIAPGTRVRVTGTKDLNLVVAPIAQ